MKKYGLGKKEKLCSQRAIEHLFSRSGTDFSALAYPLRVIAAGNSGRCSDAPVAFLISIPKKRLRHAVDRVTMRRRVREAYRLNRDCCPLPAAARIDVAFVYVADKLVSYSSVERSVRRLLGALGTHFSKPAGDECAQ